MAPKCYICKYYDSKKMSLFRIPNRNDEYSERGKIWLQLLDAKKQDINQIRICSLHFLKKKPSKADDYLDVDWVPNKNLGEYTKNWKRVDYYIRKKNALKHENNDKLYNDCPIPGQDGPDVYLNVKEKSFKIKHCKFDGKSTVSVVNFQAPSSSATDDQETDIILRESAPPSHSNSLIPMKKRKIDIIEEIIFFPKEIQTELTMEDIDLIFQYYQETVNERDELLLKLSSVLIDFNYFKDNDRRTRFFTGFPNWKLLSRFFDLVKNFIPTHFNCKLSQFQMIVVTLMKLRLNSTFTDLGYRFQIDGNTASRTFHRCIFILFKKFKGTQIIHWPEESNLIFSTPSYFRSTLKDKVTVIVDCFEIFAETPSMLRAAAQLFSQYKHHATLKILIGISMSGVIIFISKAFGGRTSDKEATKKSGLLDHLKEGDWVLADKGFLIRDEVNAKKASLHMPSFVRNGNQLHPIEIETSRKNSSLRIHVERVINILRMKFNICSGHSENFCIIEEERDIRR